ncbi:hypothetical protein ARTHRO9AX_10291 [Arthrobacter sp. 9AX]|nr:hypothetical protein ARTHRO9AX_10291 [Arthrobacter sp. 9AX]
MFPQPTPGPARLQQLPSPKHWLVTGLVLTAVVIGGAERAVRSRTQFSRGGSGPGIQPASYACADRAGPGSEPAVRACGGSGHRARYKPLPTALSTFPTQAVLFALTVSWGWAASQLFKIVTCRIRPDSASLLDWLVPEPVSNSFPAGTQDSSRIVAGLRSELNRSGRSRRSWRCPRRSCPLLSGTGRGAAGAFT